jgi:hypothetical protein
MRTISNEFKEMYGKNAPLGNRNETPNNLLKKIVPNKQFNNNVDIINSNNVKPISNEIVENKTKFPYLLILIIVIILGLAIIVYFNKDTIYSYYEQYIKPMFNNEDSVKEPPIKEVTEDELNKEEQITKLKEQEKIEKNIKEKEIEQNIKNNKIKNGGVYELNKKLNTNYTPDQIVKENSYCYIGYENGQRECTNVFDGDICMSGEIFPTMDICINPNLRP